MGADNILHRFDSIDPVVLKYALRDLAMRAGFRHDAGETAFLQQQLLHIRAQMFEVLYENLKARTLIPFVSETPSGAQETGYDTTDKVGRAAVGEGYATDSPNIDVFSRRVQQTIHPIRASYGWDIQELRAAAMARKPLSDMKARAARESHEIQIDRLSLLGDPALGFLGLFNHPQVNVTAAPTGNWQAVDADPQLIQADMHALVQRVITDSNEVHSPDTMVLDTASFALVSQKPVAVDNQMTILRSFLLNNPYINNIEQSTKLDNANAAGNGPRICVYRRDPRVLDVDIPQPFEQFPPHMHGLKWVIETHTRFAGLQVRYPRAIHYMDGV